MIKTKTLEKFREDLKNGMTINEACRKHKITFKYAVNNINKVKTKPKINKPKQNKTKKTPKYYYYNKSEDKWFVSKKINGHNLYLGKFSSEEEVKIAVELFKKYGWNKKKQLANKSRSKRNIKK